MPPNLLQSSAQRRRPRPAGASTSCAWRDLGAAKAHLERVLQARGMRAEQLRELMAQERLTLRAAAARGVLAAIDEAVALYRAKAEGVAPVSNRGCAFAAEPIAQTLAALFAEWEAEAPSGLMQLLLAAHADATSLHADAGGVGNDNRIYRLNGDIGKPLLEQLKSLRRFYTHVYAMRS